MALTESDRAVLEFEAAHPGTGAAKNDAIRTRLGLSPVRYYQKLARLTYSSEALLFDPVLVHRLRRLAEEERTTRDARSAP
ncbi:MAG TPA: DUF3263 domain-containing protein [Microbacteriaceae bacterium]|nr:DUF3263 domain-containing protein [Microbacteriaceae bacterium]